MSAKSCVWANFTDSQGNSWAIRFAHHNYPYTSDAVATRSADGLSWTIQTFPGDVAVLSPAFSNPEMSLKSQFDSNAR